MNVLIFGAGSIGLHYARAARDKGWRVTVVDIDHDALKRMPDVYTARYGEPWDEDIELAESKAFSPAAGQFGIVMIGTPPDSHLALAKDAVALRPRLLHIEKPLATPGASMREFERFASAAEATTMVVVGYNHSVAPSHVRFLERIRSGEIGDVLTIDAGVREHWQGIFDAHPWLSGAHATYLGYTHRGGGAAFEHSHGMRAALGAADAAGWGSVVIECAADMVRGDQGEHYDRVAQFTLTARDGRVGRVVQDVITQPSNKWVEAIGTRGTLRWTYTAGEDVVIQNGHVLEVHPKTRRHDFSYALEHYERLVAGTADYAESPLHWLWGTKVMDAISHVVS